MILLGDYLRVRELVKDITVDGLLQKYDDSNPYMFAEIVEAENTVYNKLSTMGNVNSMVLIFKRPAKIPFIDSYLVSYKDIIGIMSREEFENL
jgi:hypothetical protein